MAQNEKLMKPNIFRAAESGNMDVVETLLRQGENVNTADAWGNTLLFLAAWGGHKELVSRLLEQGARTDESNTLGQTALHIACERGHSAVAYLLLERGANVDPDTDYLPPLHFAMFHRDHVLVEQLIEGGADINRVDASGATSLHRACWCDCHDVVEMLLDHGVDIDLQNQSGMTALDYAIVYGHSAVVDVFINRFPDMFHSQDAKGWTRLHTASADNNTMLVTCLLNNNAEIDLTTMYGSTPLHIAIKRGSFEAAQVLLDSGATVDLKDYKGNTPLHVAAVMPAADDDAQLIVFHKLLEKGASVDVKNMNNETPFDLCQRDERFQVLVDHVTKLRAAGLFVNIKNMEVNLEMEIKCLLELKKVKEIQMYENISLKIVFSRFRDPFYLRNESLKLSLDRFLQSPRLMDSFPLYSVILRNTIQSSFYRLQLLTSVSQIFSSDEKNQWWNALPTLVQDSVLVYLTNDDLEKIQQIYRIVNC